jgi:hypothetical protein
MNKLSLFRGIAGRMVAWGVLGGGISGFIYVLLLFLFTAGNASIVCYVAAIGFIVGGFAGLVLGAVNGLVLAAITLFILPRSVSARAYRTIVYVANGLITGAGAFYAFSGLADSFGRTSSNWLFFAVIPTLIAVLLSGLAGVRVARWLEGTTSVATGPE